MPDQRTGGTRGRRVVAILATLAFALGACEASGSSATHGPVESRAPMQSPINFGVPSAGPPATALPTASPINFGVPSAGPSTSPSGTPAPLAPGPLVRIALASCFRHSADGPALVDLLATDPDLLLWLGDNIYGDTEDMATLRAKYAVLGANPRFKALDAIPDTMAIWDDHDFGWNNANRTWPFRDAARNEFLRFWGAASDDPRWEQPGVYASRTFGSGDRTVQVILLDNRYNLDPYDYAGTDPGRTILGATQWAWLRERLAEPATIRIIGSGIQVLQDYDIDEEWEGWRDTPLERDRLFALIRDLGVPGVIFVSGDMHFAELTRLPDALGYPTYDLTASGLDQVETWAEGQWINPNRIGQLLNSDRKFGIVEIDWGPQDPEIHLQIRDGARIHLDHVVRLSELRSG